MNMRNKRVTYLVQGAMIAALYVVLTWLANALGLASGAIQIRFSEALTILPWFTAAAVPGLFIGCLISNVLTGAVIWDILFGSAATLLGAIGTRLLRKQTHWLAPIPPILANVAIVPIVLKIAYGLEDAWTYLAVTVGIGETISCGVLGMLLFFTLKKHARRIFQTN